MRHSQDPYLKPVETFMENKILKWFGHCLRRENNHISAKSLRLEISGRSSAQRSTEKEMAGQHKGRHEEIPTDNRHGTRSKILDLF